MDTSIMPYLFAKISNNGFKLYTNGYNFNICGKYYSDDAFSNSIYTRNSESHTEMVKGNMACPSLEITSLNSKKPNSLCRLFIDKEHFWKFYQNYIVNNIDLITLHKLGIFNTNIFCKKLNANKYSQSKIFNCVIIENNNNVNYQVQNENIFKRFKKLPSLTSPEMTNSLNQTTTMEQHLQATTLVSATPFKKRHQTLKYECSKPIYNHHKLARKRVLNALKSLETSLVLTNNNVITDANQNIATNDTDGSNGNNTRYPKRKTNKPDFFVLSVKKRASLINSSSNTEPLSIQEIYKQSGGGYRKYDKIFQTVIDRVCTNAGNNNIEDISNLSNSMTNGINHNTFMVSTSPQVSPAVIIPYRKTAKEEIPHFQAIKDNIYTFDLDENNGDKTLKKHSKRMVCDCFIDENDITSTNNVPNNKLNGCGQDCLNRILMIECSSRCPCGEYCTNKRFQKRQYCDIEPFMTFNKGWGLRTLQDIEPGTFIVEYVGEVIDSREFNRRQKQYQKDERIHYYFMSLKQSQIIDATYKGSYSRFINHSCDPNCETQKWTVNGQLRIGFFSKKFIPKYTELCFDYQSQRYGEKPQKCFCGSPICRGFIDKKVSNDSNMPIITAPKSLATLEDVHIENEIKELADACNVNLNCNEQILSETENNLSKPTGLQTMDQVIKLCRLMVRSEKCCFKIQILKLLQHTNAEQLSIFVKLQGLNLLWTWLAVLPDINTFNKEVASKIVDLEKSHIGLTDSEVRKKKNSMKRFITETNETLDFMSRMIDVLSLLPVDKKSVLEKSKIPKVIEPWSQFTLITSTKEFDAAFQNIKLETQKLLQSWNDIKETFKIPKRKDEQSKNNCASQENTLVKTLPPSNNNANLAKNLKPQDPKINGEKPNHNPKNDVERSSYNKYHWNATSHKTESPTISGRTNANAANSDHKKFQNSTNKISPSTLSSPVAACSIKHHSPKIDGIIMPTIQPCNYRPLVNPGVPMHYNNTMGINGIHAFPPRQIIPPAGVPGPLNYYANGVVTPNPYTYEYQTPYMMHTPALPYNHNLYSTAFVETMPPSAAATYHIPQYGQGIIPNSSARLQTNVIANGLGGQHDKLFPNSVDKSSTPCTSSMSPSEAFKTIANLITNIPTPPKTSPNSGPDIPIKVTKVKKYTTRTPNKDKMDTRTTTCEDLAKTIPLPPVTKGKDHTFYNDIDNQISSLDLDGSLNDAKNTKKVETPISCNTPSGISSLTSSTPTEPCNGVLLVTNQPNQNAKNVVKNGDKILDKPKLPPHWKMAHDPSTGKPYYYHKHTKKVQWHFPSGDENETIKDNVSTNTPNSTHSNILDNTTANYSSTNISSTSNDKIIDHKNKNETVVKNDFDTKSPKNIELKSNVPQLICNGDTLNASDINSLSNNSLLTSSPSNDQHKLCNGHNVNNHTKHHNSKTTESTESLNKIAPDKFHQIKDKFRTDLSTFIVSYLTPYLKKSCTVGRIQNNEDFKYLARKLTHTIMAKEFERNQKNLENIKFSAKVKSKTETFLEKYMKKVGPVYHRKPEQEL